MNETEDIFDELQQHVDELHAGIDRANMPPAELWTSVRAHVRSEMKKEERPTMNSFATEQNVFIPPAQVSPPVRKGFHHHLSLAASLAIVLTVALAGWFATMQLNQPGGSDGQFGLSGQSDQSATCDIEPMTVDEALRIVEDPFGTANSDEPVPAWIQEEERMRVMWVADTPVVPNNFVDQALMDSFQGTPDEDVFKDATERMNSFLACAQTGTMGQAFWYIRPFEIQRIVQFDLPFFRDESAARAVLEELLPMPASGLVARSDSAFTEPEYVFSANPNISQAATSNSTNSIRFRASETIMIGITVTDQSGEIVFQNDYLGKVDPAGPLFTTERFRVIMAQSLVDEEWYVLAVIPE